MATVGTATSYDLTVGVKIDMDEAVYLLDPIDTPLLTGMGSDGLSVLGSAPATETKVEWLVDNILTPRTTLSVTATTGDTVITVASGDRTKFSTGDVIEVPKSGVSTPEVLRITGYGSTTDTLLVTRSYDGTTATNYATSATVIGLGTSLAEGSDPENARSSDRSTYFNYTQIYGPTSVVLSRTETQVAKYGVSNEFTHQLQARIKENAISREQSFLYGRRTNSTTTKIRTSGGLQYYITSNIDATSTQLTVLKIQAIQQTNYNAGGLPDRLITNPACLLDLNDVGNTSIIRQEIDDPKRGRVRTETVWTEFGPIAVVRDRWVAKTDAFLIKRDNVIRRVLQPLIMEPLAKTGDSQKAMIVAEEGLEVKGQEQMARFNALSY